MFTILTIIMSFIIALGCIEIVARLFFLPHDIQSKSNIFYEKHKQIGSVHIPNKTGTSYGWHPRKDIRKPKGVRVQINSLGLNDKEYTYNKPTNTFRILLLGDSMLEAIQVKQKNSFQALLEGMLNGDRDYLWGKEVINAGCAGYGTDNELLFFQNEGYKYNPDITILCIFPWNDIRNNSNALEQFFFERSKFPHFEIGQNGELVLKKENFSNEYEPVINTHTKLKSKSVYNFKQFIRNYLESYHLLRDIIKYRLPFLADFMISMGVLSSSTGKKLNGYPAYEAIYAKKWCDKYMEAWQITKAIIIRLKKMVENKGSKFMVVIIPDNLQVHQKWWSDYLSTLKFSDLNFDLLKPNKVLVDFFENNKIKYLDLHPYLIESFKKSRKILYYRVDSHFNTNGHKAVSIIIYDWLISLDLIPK